ncbi:dynein axonemal heavy chain 5-like isoform X3 [Hemicordylus capensis]|nr:dynein axonemal heavy chain 5-like isoform X3 [Hemicordylus capensis]
MVNRIPMAPNCKIVFEPHNIDNASPATVSRNGMVFMSSSALSWSPVLEGFLKKRSPQEAEILRQLYTASFPDLYCYSIQSLEAKMKMLEAFVIMQSINILQGLIPCKEQGGEITAVYLERLYVFSLMWSVGAVMELEDRCKMEHWLRHHDTIKLDLPNITEACEDTMFDYYVTNDGKWMHWNTCVEEYVCPANSTLEYGSILVPNVDNVRTDFLIQTMAKQCKAVLPIGEQGTDRTVIIKGHMSKYNPESHMAKSLNFSLATTPFMFQRTIEGYVDKRMGTTYGPPAGKEMTVFTDDVNMPIINEWRDQCTIESYVDKRMGTTYGPPAGKEMTALTEDVNMPMINEWGDQCTIESYVDKRMGTTYGPPAGKEMTVFTEDVNMPMINEWGDQCTIESHVDKRMGTTYGPPAGKEMTVFTDDVNMPMINEWGNQ